jgi:hypothetical protein
MTDVFVLIGSACGCLAFGALAYQAVLIRDMARQQRRIIETARRDTESLAKSQQAQFEHFDGQLASMRSDHARLQGEANLIGRTAFETWQRMHQIGRVASGATKEAADAS